MSQLCQINSDLTGLEENLPRMGEETTQLDTGGRKEAQETRSPAEGAAFETQIPTSTCANRRCRPWHHCESTALIESSLTTITCYRLF